MDKSKRNLTKVLSIAGASTPLWSKPVVDSISLPVHAQTTNDECFLELGCYQIEECCYTSWPGGSGPHELVPGGHQQQDCSDQIPPEASWLALVISKSQEEAQDAFNLAGIDCTPQPNEIQPPELPEGCTMYACFR